MKLWMLGSGSSGNAVLIESGEDRIVIDVGFGPRIMSRRLRAAGVEPESVSACFVTHEHSDHISGVVQASKRWGWPVFASAGTLAGPELEGVQGATTIAAGKPVALSQLVVESVRVPHDARETVGYVVTESSSGVRAGVFYDLGCVTSKVRLACVDLDILVLESNHDDDLLRTGPYAPWLQARIAGRFGHLNNSGAGELAAASVCGNLNHIVLAHLSEQCNEPKVALQTVGSSLRKTRFKGRLTASSQDRVVGPFQPKFSRAEKPKQLELGF
jgi:phosphoribosyl 1,2-cyclic phosphodiesterase